MFSFYDIVYLANIVIRILPQPLHTPDVDEEQEQVVQAIPSIVPSQAVTIRTPAPPYGQRTGWKPSTQEDYGAFAIDVDVISQADKVYRRWWCLSGVSCSAVSAWYGQEEGACTTNHAC